MSTPFIQIQLASPNDIARWSQVESAGNVYVRELLTADTINYRNFEPERGGLFCKKIFGPMASGECGCGVTKRRQKSITLDTTQTEITKPEFELGTTTVNVDVCPACGTAPADARVRRYRIARVTLPKPVAHRWYFKSTPNILGSLLPIQTTQDILDIIYFCRYWPTAPDTINYCLHPNNCLWEVDEWEVLPWFFATAKGLSDQPAPWNKNPTIERGSDLVMFKNTGAEAIEIFLSRIDFAFLDKIWTAKIKAGVANGGKGLVSQKAIHAQIHALKTFFPSNLRIQNNILMPYRARLNSQHIIQELPSEKPMRRRWGFSGDSRASRRTDLIRKSIVKYVERLRCVRGLMRKNLRPEWIIISVFPVLPPNLRPMIQLSGGRFATSDINDLYRRLMHRKFRFDKTKKMFHNDHLPGLLVRQNLILIQEAADAIIDNGRLAKPMVRANRTLFKSLTGVIEGKQGRFRQNLLGKRVDYSGRSVIVVGPKLQLHQCGLPREMALELFQPFVIRALLAHADVANIRAAKNLIQRRTPLVWQILETVIQGHPVLLNRAPTLHRLGIQAFEPILLPGRAIQLHPLVCPAFNADFDGDQIAVHVPLSLEAQAEARLLMLATRNWLSPATGDANILPSQDMILGFYYLTASKPVQVKQKQKLRRRTRRHIRRTVNQNVFSNFDHVLQSFSIGKINLHDWIWVVWHSSVQTEKPAPQQIILSRSGHARTVYQNYVMEQYMLYLEQVNLSDRISVLTETSATTKFFIRTTPGRIIFNNLLYENLFL